MPFSDRVNKAIARRQIHVLNMTSDDYASIPSTGRLKIKGVADGRIDKKRKKKKKQHHQPEAESEIEAPKADRASSRENDFVDRSVVLKSLEDEDAEISKTSHREAGTVDVAPLKPGAGGEEEDVRDHILTESQKRFEEQRRKRLEERLKREGVKTHKQRVEELNKYLSSLSEHHDMPKIGPG